MAAVTTPSVCFVLHAHLPDVRAPELEDALEERWYFEAVANAYLPLIATFEALVRDGVAAPITLSISPTLLAMAADKSLNERCERWLSRSLEAASFLARFAPSSAADAHWRRVETASERWRECGGDWVANVRRLSSCGAIELWTTSATHAVLPLIESPRVLTAQVRAGRGRATEAFGHEPDGFWLPECAVSDAVDAVLGEEGVRLSVVDKAAFERGTPRPTFGVYAVGESRSGVRYLARDERLSDLIWSRDTGYPGAAEYLDFHSDAALAIPGEWSAGLRLPGGLFAPSNVRVHAVTDRASSIKRMYDVHAAAARAESDAAHFVNEIGARVAQLASAGLDAPVMTLAFDAELFGHWWGEGPAFLSAVLRALAGGNVARPCTASAGAERARSETLRLAPSSWGAGADFSTWTCEPVASENARLRELEHAFERRIPSLSSERLVRTAGALLSAQASDYAFLIATGANVGYARAAWHERLDAAALEISVIGLEARSPRARLAAEIRPVWLEERKR